METPMTGAPDPQDAHELRANSHEPIRYPTNHLLAVVDTRDQATAAINALTSGGFMDSEIELGTGAANADLLDSSTGRSGLAGMLIRLAERIGISDEEMETKDRYEQAMRDNRFVIAIVAPTGDRKQRATEILKEHGAHTMAFFNKHTIEYVTPPERK
jgi:hypothetical protein